MDFSVYRPQWWRGRGDNSGLCLFHQGVIMRDVFGFYGLALGYKDKEMIGAPTPLCTLGPRRLWPLHLLTPEVFVLVTTANDYPGISDVVREKLLTQMFSELGSTLTFEGP